MQTALLTTVNGPYQDYLDAEALAVALANGDIAKGQVPSFFTEIDMSEQIAFAKAHSVSMPNLTKVASEFSEWSGQAVALTA